MKYRYKFTEDYYACPTGYAQRCNASQKKLFKKGDAVWGSIGKNAIGGDDGNGGTLQGYDLVVSDSGEDWDIPLPPLDKSPVIPAPIFTIGRFIVLIIIGIIVYAFIKVRREGY